MEVHTLIEKLNTLGEQEKIEAKAAQKIGKSILETICAFANEPDLDDGYLLLGVKSPEDHSERYEMVGVTNPERLLEDLVSQCRTTFNKPVEIETTQQSIDGKTILGIYVPEINNISKPVYFKKQRLPEGAYRRMGTSDVKCTEDDLIILYQNRNIESYDLTPLKDATWEDIDSDAIEDYRRLRSTVQSDAGE